MRHACFRTCREVAVVAVWTEVDGAGSPPEGASSPHRPTTSVVSPVRMVGTTCRCLLVSVVLPFPLASHHTPVLNRLSAHTLLNFAGFGVPERFEQWNLGQRDHHHVIMRSYPSFEIPSIPFIHFCPPPTPPPNPFLKIVFLEKLVFF